MNTSAIGSPATNSPQAPISTSRRHPFGMARRNLGRDPAADAMADQVEARQVERVEEFEIVEDHVVDGGGVELVGAIAAGMRRRDHVAVLRQPLMERHEISATACTSANPCR